MDLDLTESEFYNLNKKKGYIHKLRTFLCQFKSVNEKKKINKFNQKLTDCKLFEVYEFINTHINSPIKKVGNTFSLNEITKMDPNIVESTIFKIKQSSPENKFI